MSTVVLYSWCHSDSASVLLYFTFEFSVGIEVLVIGLSPISFFFSLHNSSSKFEESRLRVNDITVARAVSQYFAKVLYSYKSCGSEEWWLIGDLNLIQSMICKDLCATWVILFVLSKF